MLVSELIAELQKLQEKSGRDLNVILAWSADYEDYCKEPVVETITNDIADIPELYGELVIRIS